MSLAVADGGLLDVTSAEYQGLRNPFGNFGFLSPFVDFDQKFQDSRLFRTPSDLSDSFSFQFMRC